MINTWLALKDGTIITEVYVENYDYEGKRWAYLTLNTYNNLPVVRLEKELSMLSKNIIGFHFKFDERDFVICRGYSCDLDSDQIEEFKNLLKDNL